MRADKDWQRDPDTLSHLEAVSAMLLHGAKPWQIAETFGYSLEDAERDIDRVRLLREQEAQRVSTANNLAQVSEVQLRAWEQFDKDKDSKHLRVILEAERDRERIYQQTLFDTEVEIPPDTVPGQAEAQRGKRYFFTYLAESFPYIEDVYKLMAEGWDWRKAVLIVYEATPKDRRQPATYKKLATECLNLSGPRVFSNWRRDKDWPIDTTAVRVAMERATQPGPERLSAVIGAMYDTAAIPGREGHADRRLLTELLGLIQGSGVNVTALAGAQAQTAVAVGGDIPDDELDSVLSNLIVATVSQAVGDEQADRAAIEAGEQQDA